MVQPLKAFDLDDDERFGLNLLTTKVFEMEADTELGNWTGLLNNKGQPLFREKERIGFKTWK
jgi:hypothetical protein